MSLPRSAFSFAALAFVTGLLAAAPARADAIDGSWCSADGRNLSIRGPAVVTPGGHRMLGTYSRHAFSYTVPDGEPGAGSEISMILISDDIVHLQPRPEADVEVWNRCQLQMS